MQTLKWGARAPFGLARYAGDGAAWTDTDRSDRFAYTGTILRPFSVDRSEPGGSVLAMDKKTFLQTGAVWQKPDRERRRIVQEVCVTLESAYQPTRLGNPDDPLDDLIYIIISNKTSPTVARAVYSELKSEFSDWRDVLVYGADRIAEILRPAGLANVKSSQIRAALARICDDFGVCDLNNLRGQGQEDIEAYLVSLPGVSEKVAKCVMMYTMGVVVLPVDSHVHRVTRRLGWTARKRADQAHKELEALVPPQKRFSFHVNCILHGRAVCRPQAPLCQICAINYLCNFYQERR